MRKTALCIILAASISAIGANAQNTAPKFDSDHIVSSFAVISDVHIEKPDNAPSKKFKAALEQLAAKAAEQDKDGLDAVMVAGDLINNAYASPENYVQMDWFKAIYESVLDPVKVPLVYTPGNHDVFREWTDDALNQARNLSARLGPDYFLKDVDNDMRTRKECRHCIVNGYHILGILPIGRNPVVYDPECLQWLDDRLKAITGQEPDKYVLILTHPMVTNTVYGSRLGDYWATEALTPILSKYPQVVIFGGHLHFPLNDPRSIWQGSFTAMGTASVRYMAIEDGKYENMRSKTVMRDADEFSQGLLLQMDAEGNIRATRMDFYNNRTIGSPWIIGHPAADLSHLKTYSHELRRAANKAPRLNGFSTSVNGETLTVSWPAGSDDEFVHHYQLALTNRATHEISLKKVLADFYRVSRPSEMKQEWSLDFTGLEPGRYALEIVAFDSWGAASKPIKKQITIN